LDDGLLLREVAKLDNTTVVIVYGSNDTVVRIEGDVARRLKKEFPTVRFVRMKGLGHDPFEEDVKGFMTKLEKAIES
jgi:pimeloyl-ACP methyl ester carboxylesterase